MRVVFFLEEVLAEKLKKHKSIDEQIALLESRNLLIADKQFARDVLQNVNYYRLSGYLHNYKQEDSDKYIEGISFEQILQIYEFDTRLTRLLMFVLEDIEETLKTRLSYSLSSMFPNDPKIYLKKKIYRDEEEFKKFRKIFRTAKANNQGIPFIKHHNVKYNGQLPIWVAVEIFTMGNIDSMYSNLEGKYQKKIAATYNTGSMQLQNWIENLRYTRNHLAHYMRIYRYSFGRIPKSCSNHVTTAKYTGKIFDQIMIMKFMYSKPEEWNEYVLPELERLFESYKDVVELSGLGFPDDWKDHLKI